MSELEKAIDWLEHWKMVKECDARNYPHRTEHAEIADNCRVLLDALRWIPVGERPKEGQAVLFNCICDMHVSDLYGMYKGYYKDGIFWIDSFDHDAQFGASVDLVTHWRPLPEAPKEG